MELCVHLLTHMHGNTFMYNGPNSRKSHDIFIWDWLWWGQPIWFTIHHLEHLANGVGTLQYTSLALYWKRTSPTCIAHPCKYKVKDMDVYMALVVDELKYLWEGISIQDLSWRIGYQHVNLKAILMLTMHDSPGYKECSGLAKTSGYHACPICGPTINARYLQSLKKMVYKGHKMFLTSYYPLQERFLVRPPKTWDVFSQYDVWQASLGALGMKQLSIFHSLPY